MCMNDHELTKQRQQEIKEKGVQQGYPLYVVWNNDSIKLFIGKQNADKWIEVNGGRMTLAFIEDVQSLSCKII